MDPFQVQLPKKLSHLIMMYVLVNRIINNIWVEYTCYCEAMNTLPKTNLIFPIIFHELDFYESLLGRLSVHLPEDILKELRNEEDFWHW
jgi:hypothetical protein